MRDTIITVRKKKTEIIILSICISIAILLNIAAIIIYDTQWSELYTQWFVVLLFGISIYAFSWLVRILFWGVKRILSKH